MAQPELELTEYIKKHGLEKLCDTYSISAKRHGKYNNLVLLKYDQINSDPKVKLVRQARGIILDEANNWQIVNYSYSRFSNYGEGWGAKVDWNTARVYDKLDGSLIQLYYYDGAWQVASSGMPDAAGQVNGFDRSFAELFWEVWNELGYKLPTDTKICYAFELMTKYNRVIVKHEKSDIVLHGARDLSDLRELNPIVEAYNNKWKCVPTYPINTIEDALETAKTLDPMKSEGYVVCDAQFNRLKVKSPQYVAMSHLKESVGMSKRQLLEVVRLNESSEFLTAFPEFTNDYYDVKAKYERLIGQMEGFYEAIKELQVGKEFASKAKKATYSDALFQMKYDRYKDFKHYVAEMSIKTLEGWLGLKVEDEV